MTAELSRAPAEGEPHLRDADLTGLDLSGVDFRHKHLENVFFGANDERVSATLTAARFRHARLDRVSFVGCELDGVDFRFATLLDCDFRYVLTRRTTFSDAEIVGCDFYRAVFDIGTLFKPARLEHVSMSTWLQGMAGLEFAHMTDALMHDMADGDYLRFLVRTKKDSPDKTPREQLDERLGSSAAVYRSLSATWSAQGAFQDAGRAYAAARDLERRAAWRSVQATGRGWRRLGALTLSKYVSGYGLKLGRVVATIGLLWLVPGLVYWLAGAVQEGSRDAGFLDTLLFSLGQLTSSAPGRLDASTALVEWLGLVQILGGVTLLGLLGFVLGNSLRSS